MNAEEIILSEITNHEKSLADNEKTLRLWAKDINEWSTKILNRTEPNIDETVRIMADQSSAMVRLLDNIKTAQDLIDRKKSLLLSLEGFGDSLE